MGHAASSDAFRRTPKGNPKTASGSVASASPVDAGGSSPSSPSQSRLSKVRTSFTSRNVDDLVHWTPAHRWHMLIGSKKAAVSQSRGGCVGLKNLGNTCFMNAGLQCLSHLEPVSAYFLTGKFAEEVNTSNTFGTRGCLVKAFAKLQEMLWQRNSKQQNPKQIHSTLAKYAPHLFSSYEQQDAQEFLAFLLDGLHEDLNLIKERPPPRVVSDEDEEEDENARLERERGEEYVAAFTWMHHLLRHKSFLVDLFQGQLRSVVRCGRCGLISKAFDPYLYMSLPVHDEMETLEDALRLFLAEEALMGDEQWRCPRCKCRVQATKKIDIWKVPPVLVIHLKRFGFDNKSQRFRKISANIHCPLEVDLTDFVATEHGEGLVYDVACVANHAGQLGSGHYTATCRHSLDGRFYTFNDDHVHEVQDLNHVVTNQAYVLFLVRREDSDQALVRQSVSHPEVWPHAVSKRNSAMLPAVWEMVSTARASPSNVSSDAPSGVARNGSGSGGWPKFPSLKRGVSGGSAYNAESAEAAAHAAAAAVAEAAAERTRPAVGTPTSTEGEADANDALASNVVVSPKANFESGACSFTPKDVCVVKEEVEA